jgi:type II secretory pathway pseudopilin PulG
MTRIIAGHPVVPRHRRRVLRRPSGARRGFTLLETIISMTLVMTIVALATRMLTQQTRMLSQQSGRLEAQQNAQFSLATLDREMRVAGIGVVDKQPIVVMAAAQAFTFNADLVSRVPGDPGTVYIDPDADSASTLVFQRADRTTLPLSNTYYPDSTYSQVGGVPSGAETISFWVSRDSTSPATNEYLLFRRVNAATPHVVARGIRINPTDTIFQYFKRDSTGASFAISPALLPLYHSAPIHGSKADTGQYALIDSITTVRVRMTTMYRDRNGVQIIRRIDMTIQLNNAGLIRSHDCGQPPLGVTPTGVAALDSVTGNPVIRVTWARSGDEIAGEQDVERYTVFRREPIQGVFTDPIASIPAGTATYSFTDNAVAHGDQWVYGVAAQDCTPASSAIGSTLTVIVP